MNLLNIKGIDASGNLIRELEVAVIGDAHYTARLHLEAFPRVAYMFQGEELAVEREPFYQSDLWDIPVRMLLTRLHRRLQLSHPHIAVEMFSLTARLNAVPLNDAIPALDHGCYTVACYVTDAEGESEGRYLHVDLIHGHKVSRLGFLKHFGPPHDTWAMARSAHEFLTGKTATSLA